MKEKTKKNQKITPLSKNPYKRRSEIEMVKITKEIQSGLLGIRAASLKYGLNRNTLKSWMTRIYLSSLGREQSPQIITATMTDDQQSKALNQKVKELTKALELSKLKIEGLETMIKVAEEDLHIKIRKKPGTKQSKE